MSPSMNVVKTAVIAAPDIFEKAEHENKDTGKRTSVPSNFSMWMIFILYPCVELQRAQGVTLREVLSFLLVTS